MTDKDEFAVRAMEALIGISIPAETGGYVAINTVTSLKAEIAEAAYKLADAMIVARGDE